MLIRLFWLLHVLPKGLTRVRHYGFLGGAAGRAYRRLRFLLGGKPFTVEMPEDKPPSCPCCGREMLLLGKLFPVRKPPQMFVSIVPLETNMPSEV